MIRELKFAYRHITLNEAREEYPFDTTTKDKQNWHTAVEVTEVETGTVSLKVEEKVKVTEQRDSEHMAEVCWWSR